MYHGSGPQREPHWWEEVWVLTRAVFGVLFWPLVALFGAIIGIVLIIYLFAVHPLLGLAGLAVVGVGIWLFSRWEQRGGVPPYLPPPGR